jgi:transcriptional regulator with XRE-family HTH domain
MADDDAARRREAGQRVARWRQRRGLTRQQFADLCGRSPSWVDKVERGERALLRLPMLERVADVLRIPVDVLTDPEQARTAAGACLDAFEIRAIREALQRYGAITKVLRSPVASDRWPDVSRVRQQVAYAWSSFQNGTIQRSVMCCRACCAKLKTPWPNTLATSATVLAYSCRRRIR